MRGLEALVEPSGGVAGALGLKQGLELGELLDAGLACTGGIVGEHLLGADERLQRRRLVEQPIEQGIGCLLNAAHAGAHVEDERLCCTRLAGMLGQQVCGLGGVEVAHSEDGCPALHLECAGGGLERGVGVGAQAHEAQVGVAQVRKALLHHGLEQVVVKKPQLIGFPEELVPCLARMIVAFGHAGVVVVEGDEDLRGDGAGLGRHGAAFHWEDARFFACYPTQTPCLWVRPCQARTALPRVVRLVGIGPYASSASAASRIASCVHSSGVKGTCTSSGSPVRSNPSPSWLAFVRLMG